MHYQDELTTVLNGDCLTELRKMPDASVRCCVTSPPYYGLRDYGRKEQIGLEPTPVEYVKRLVGIFEEVRRVLRPDGTLWLNLGDSYASTAPGTMGDKLNQRGILSGVSDRRAEGSRKIRPETPAGLKPKDLIGIPWRVAFALRDAGWYLRQDIIWNKPNPMPESVTDRCTKAHEYIFLLTKSARYYFNQDTIREPLKDSSISRLGQDIAGQSGSDRVPGKTNGNMKAVVFGGNNRCPDTRLQSGNEWKPKERDRSMRRNRNGITGSLDRKNFDPSQGGGGHGLRGHSGNFDANGDLIGDGTANKKSVWTVSTRPFKEAHFATFPEKLIEPCILAGSAPGDIVLDPFAGAGTTLLVAKRFNRKGVGIELNPEYCEIIARRLGR